MEKNRYTVLVCLHSPSSPPPQPLLFLVQPPVTLLGIACLHNCPVITGPHSQRLLLVLVNNMKPFVGRVLALSSRFLPCQCTQVHRGPMHHQEDHLRGSQWSMLHPHTNTTLMYLSKKMVHVMCHSISSHKWWAVLLPLPLLRSLPTSRPHPTPPTTPGCLLLHFQLYPTLHWVTPSIPLLVSCHYQECHFTAPTHDTDCPGHLHISPCPLNIPSTQAVTTALLSPLPITQTLDTV